jgi:hypothetical protein
MLLPDGGADQRGAWRGRRALWSWSEGDGWRWASQPTPMGHEVVEVRKVVRTRARRRANAEAAIAELEALADIGDARVMT